tara:strand:- start:538 stop:816 length:279 start_codon:yes stop_codon:yes gene_type:complete
VVKMNKNEILEEAMRIINNDRNADYGDAKENFDNTAQFWSAYTGHEYNAVDVAVMMMLVKISRIRVSPDKVDHFVDLCGYASLCGEISSNGG